MQYNYYSLYNITEARASDKHLARITKAGDDQRSATQKLDLKTDSDLESYRNAKKAGDGIQAKWHLRDSKARAAEAADSRRKLHNLYRAQDRLETHIRDRKGEQGKKPAFNFRQSQIRLKVAENKFRLKSEAENKARLKSEAEKKARLKAEAENKAAEKKAEAENKAAEKKAEAENKAAEKKAEAKKKAAQHKTKIQQHGRKQKLGAVLAGGGFAGSAALFKSAHDDVTG